MRESRIGLISIGGESGNSTEVFNAWLTEKRDTGHATQVFVMSGQGFLESNELKPYMVETFDIDGEPLVRFVKQAGADGELRYEIQVGQAIHGELILNGIIRAPADEGKPQTQV